MEIFVARQPIFDARHRVLGYELLYRNDSEAQTAGTGSPHGMSSQLVVDAVLGMGLDQLTGGRTAFINVSREMLLDGMADLLNPDDVVLELIETIEPDDEVVAACRALVSRGFKLAMDDFVYDDAYVPLLELAKIVKVDVLALGPDRVASEVKKLAPFNVKLLAEKVENEQVHATCVELGFEMFQGFHYFRPETLTKKDLSTESIAVVRLLNLLRDERSTDTMILEGFRSDPGLSYKLLRMVNSAAMGGRGIDSIGHALRLMGREPLYRWMCLMLLAGRGRGGEVQAEIIKSALMRGRMCELLGDAVRGSNGRDVPPSGTLFLVGLFSHLPDLLHMSMADALDQISLASGVTDALLGRDCPAGAILSSVAAYEEADWDVAEGYIASLGGDGNAISDVYLDSITWAGNRMGLHEG